MGLQILSILAPLVVCAGIGFVWGRRGATYDAELTTSIIMNLGAPCLIFAELSSLEADPRELGELALGALLAMGVFAGIGAGVLRVARLPAQTYLAPLVFANTGNVGLPLCLFAFGSDGLALATSIFATVSIANFTIGVWIWSGRASLRTLGIPISYATLLAVGVLVTGVQVPLWIRNVTELIGGLPSRSCC